MRRKQYYYYYYCFVRFLLLPSFVPLPCVKQSHFVRNTRYVDAYLYRTSVCFFSFLFFLPPRLSAPDATDTCCRARTYNESEYAARPPPTSVPAREECSAKDMEDNDCGREKKKMKRKRKKKRRNLAKGLSGPFARVSIWLAYIKKIKKKIRNNNNNNKDEAS